VLDRDEDVNWVSARNLPNVHILAPDQLNTYDVLVNDDVCSPGPRWTPSWPARSGAGPRPSRGERGDRAPGKRQGEEAKRPRRRSQAGKAKKGRAAAAMAGLRPGQPRPARGRLGAEGFPIKGNAGSKLYHVPGSSHYNRTVAEVWFATEEDAENAGFQLPPSQRQRPRRRRSDPRPRDVLLAPVISEKSYGLLEENKYTFVVAPDANKTQIKIASRRCSACKVVSVNTLNRQGKRKRTRTGYGKRKDTKRAIVTLTADSKPIEIFGGRPVSGLG
jgi:large subunit ribosomal protein L23